MQTYKSIRGKEISIDEQSEFQTITEILQSRFEQDDTSVSSLEKLHDPYLMRDMDRAVLRIVEAKEK
jgi:hypothetical protein